MPRLTIGMACYDDFPGVWMTIQALRAYHRDVLNQCELIVVDNHPESAHGQACQNLVNGWVRSDFSKYRYVPFSEYNSTARPRQLIFELAEAENVLVIDSHVVIPRKAGQISPLQRLIDYYIEHPGTMNLLQGPLLYDDLLHRVTHFDDKIREEMWGVWGHDARGDHLDNPPFEIPAHGLGLFSARKEAWLRVGGFNPNFRGFGGEEWYIHEKFRKYGVENNVDARTLCLPFLNWVHRFGHVGGVRYPLMVLDKVRNYIIGCNELNRKDRLIRFAKHFVGMDNEDGSKRKGPRVSAEQWTAIIRDPYSYPIAKVTPAPNPNYTPNPNPENCPSLKGTTTEEPAPVWEDPALIPSGLSAVEYNNWLSDRPTDISVLTPLVAPYLQTAKRILYILRDRIEPALGAVELGCEHRVLLEDSASVPLTRNGIQALVSAYERRSGSVLGTVTDAISAWQDNTQEEIFTLPQLFRRMKEVGNGQINEDLGSGLVDACDCVVIQGWIEAEPLMELLSSISFLATGRIIIYGSQLWSEISRQKMDDYGNPVFQEFNGAKRPVMIPGILPAIRAFCGNDPEWSVLEHIGNAEDSPTARSTGMGCTVLTRLAADRKSLPSTLQMAANFAKALASHVASGGQEATPEELRIRLMICSDCPNRNVDACSICGCFLAKKAAWATQQCPIGRWTDPHLRDQVKNLVQLSPSAM